MAQTVLEIPANKPKADDHQKLISQPMQLVLKNGGAYGASQNL